MNSSFYLTNKEVGSMQLIICGQSKEIRQLEHLLSFYIHYKTKSDKWKQNWAICENFLLKVFAV